MQTSMISTLESMISTRSTFFEQRKNLGALVTEIHLTQLILEEATKLLSNLASSNIKNSIEMIFYFYGLEAVG